MGICIPTLSEKDMEIVVCPSESLGPEYTQRKTLTRDDVKKILKKTMYMAYNMRRSEKRDLQRQRSKLIKNGLSKDYLELIKRNKHIQNETLEEATNKALEDFKVTRPEYKAATETMDMTALTQEVLKDLFEDIRANKHKLSVSEAMVKEIQNKYQQIDYNCNYTLSASPELARELSELYGQDSFIDYIEIMAADTLYNEYELLPLEVKAFAQ